MSTEYEHYHCKVLEKYLDIFGHVNNSKYLELYEDARWDFMTRHGYGMQKIMDEQIGPVILDLHLTFRRELKNRDEFHIETIYQGQKNKLVSIFHQKMVSPEGKTLSTLELTVGLMDLKKRKLIPPSVDWQKVLDGK